MSKDYWTSTLETGKYVGGESVGIYKEKNEIKETLQKNN